MVEQKFTHASGASFNPGYAENPLPIPAKTPIPDFLGIAKSSVQLMDAVNTDAFIQGRIDALAGNIDEDKFFGRSAYLQGAEFVDYSTKLNEAKALILDDINKTVAENGTVEDFKQRFYKRTQGLSETITSFNNRPEARNLMLQHLTALADGSTQQFVAQRLKHRYKLAEAEDFMTASNYMNAVIDGSITPEIRDSTMTLLEKNALDRGENPMGAGTRLANVVKAMMPGLDTSSANTWKALESIKTEMAYLSKQGKISISDSTAINQALAPKILEGIKAQGSTLDGKLERIQILHKANPSTVLTEAEFNENENLIYSLGKLGLPEETYKNLRNKNLKTFVETNKFTSPELLSANASARSVRGIKDSEQADAQIAQISKMFPDDPTALYANMAKVGAETGNTETVDRALKNISTQISILKGGDAEELKDVDASAIDAFAESIKNPFVRDRAVKFFGADVVDFLETQWIPGSNVVDMAMRLSDFRTKSHGMGIVGVANGFPKFKGDDVESALRWETNISDNLASFIAMDINNSSVDILRGSGASGLKFSADKEEYFKQLQGQGYVTVFGSNNLIFSPVPLSKALGTGKGAVNKALEKLFDDPVNDFDIFGRDYYVRYDPHTDTFTQYKDDGDATGPTGINVSGEKVRKMVQSYDRKETNARYEEQAKVVLDTVWTTEPIKAYQELYKDSNLRRTVVGTTPENASILGQAMLMELKHFEHAMKPAKYKELQDNIKDIYIFGNPTDSDQQRRVETFFELTTGKKMKAVVDDVFGKVASGKIELTDSEDGLSLPKPGVWENFASFLDSYNSDIYDSYSGEYHAPLDRKSIGILSNACKTAEQTGDTFMLGAYLENITGEGLDFWVNKYAEYLPKGDIVKEAKQSITKDVVTETKDLTSDEQKVLNVLGSEPYENTLARLEGLGMDKDRAERLLSDTRNLIDKRLQSDLYRQRISEIVNYKVPYSTEQIQRGNDELAKYGVPGGDEVIERLSWFRTFNKRPDRISAPYFITKDIVAGPLGDMGVKFMKGLYLREQFLIAPANTRSAEDQKNPDLHQVHVIGMGVSEQHTDVFPAMVATAGDALELSIKQNQFVNRYYSSMPRRAEAIGLNWQDLTSNPKLQPLAEAWADYVWMGGFTDRQNKSNKGDSYSLLITLAKNGKLAEAVVRLKKTAPWKEAGESPRRQLWLDGLTTASRL